MGLPRQPPTVWFFRKPKTDIGVCRGVPRSRWPETDPSPQPGHRKEGRGTILSSALPARKERIPAQRFGRQIGSGEPVDGRCGRVGALRCVLGAAHLRSALLRRVHGAFLLRLTRNRPSTKNGMGEHTHPVLVTCRVEALLHGERAHHARFLVTRHFAVVLVRARRGVDRHRPCLAGADLA